MRGGSEHSCAPARAFFKPSSRGATGTYRYKAAVSGVADDFPTCRNRTGQIPIGAGHAIGIMHGGTHQSRRQAELLHRVSLFGQQHAVVPDGRGSINPADIHHWVAVIVASPDANHVIAGIDRKSTRLNSSHV